MQDRKQEKDQSAMSPSTKAQQSHATSKETLEDLEKSEEISTLKSEGDSEKSQIPSPDGTVDESRKQKDDAGPM